MSEAPSGTRAKLWLVLKLSGVALLIAAPIWGRALGEGRAEMAAAQQSLADEQLRDAVVHFGRAARWRTPLSRHDERAVAELMTLGEQALEQGDGEVALAAFREVRGALLATRVFGVPQRAEFDRANDEIAALMAQQERQLGTDVGGTGDPQAFHRELLDDIPGPNPILTALASVAFVMFVLSVLGMFRYGIDDEAKPVPKHAVRFGAAIVVFLAGWLALLRLS